MEEQEKEKLFSIQYHLPHHLGVLLGAVLGGVLTVLTGAAFSGGGSFAISGFSLLQISVGVLLYMLGRTARTAMPVFRGYVGVALIILPLYLASLLGK